MSFRTYNGRIRTFRTRVFRYLRSSPVLPPEPEICGIPGVPDVQVISQSSARVILFPGINSQVLEVRFRRVGDATWSTRTATTEIILSGLAPGTTYEVQARSLCSETTSAYSASRVFTTQEEVIEPPAVCGLATGLLASAVSSNAAVVSWSAGENALTYHIRYRVQGAGAWTEITTGNTAVSLSGLAPETTYEFQVQTICDGLLSAYTASATFTTAQEPVTGSCVAPQVTYTPGNGTLTITVS